MDIVKKKKQDTRKYEGYFSEKCSLENSKNKLKCQAYRFGQVFDIDEELENCSEVENKINQNNHYEKVNDFLFSANEEKLAQEEYIKDNSVKISEKNKTSENKKTFFINKIYFSWTAVFLIAVCLVGSAGIYIKKGISTEKKVLGISKEAYGNVNGAIESAKGQDFLVSSDKFKEAYQNFSEMSDSLRKLGTGVISISRFIPGASKLSSGYYLTQAGKELSLAGEKVSQMATITNDLKNKSANNERQADISVLQIFLSFEKDLNIIKGHLIEAQENLNKVKTDDIPVENQAELISLKTKLPIVIAAVDEFSANSHIGADFLGANGPRKYLFLFQNNQEMRATGGFIGSYGILDISGEGKIRNFFIDGIFNPDGQLTDMVVPPKPIQKISAAWSLHDSNWFPDFPTSAKKAMSFYEKTGGPTVDGVITLTPTVMQKLLEITGPIEMPDYEVVLTKDNFIQNIQYEVEEDYDKEENRPKKILSDLAPIILDRLAQTKDMETLLKTMNILGAAFEEKHILLYFSNQELQKIISDIGWSGELLETSNDYLSVVNTNINGYKTDGVVEEKIDQNVEILSNGDIIDTITIKRKHTGGNTQYEWWNKVNANYMRVYVPRGSTLLEVEGQTREINKDVLDYKSLGYEEDEDVKKEESQMKIDEKTGTRVYNEKNKTVFANWVYVSPQEEVTVKYKYLLPFRADNNQEFNSYSLLAQKQSGSLGDEFGFSLSYPSDWKDEWKSAELKKCNVDEAEKYLKVCFNGNLKTDKFIGAVFVKN